MTITATPDAGKAVDTITIDESSYINDGVSEPPKDSGWATIVINPVTKAHKISVTFSDCSDNTNIPDKYKHTVNASAGIGGSVSPETQKIVSGHSASIDITPDEGMAVDTINDGNNEYVNNGKEIS